MDISIDLYTALLPPHLIEEWDSKIKNVKMSKMKKSCPINFKEKKYHGKANQIVVKVMFSENIRYMVFK